MHSPHAIETSGLTKRFGGRPAVEDVDLRVPRGCAFGYLGPNGAGKTTLIRMLLGLTQSTAGTMSLLGRSLPDERTLALARVGAIVRRTAGSTARSPAPASPSARTSASSATRRACASGSASPAPCSPTPSC